MTDDAPLKEQERLLSMVDILEPLPPREIERLVRRSAVARLKTREVLTLDEDRRRLLILVSGRVWVYEANPKGQDLTIAVAEGGAVLGQTGFAVRRSRMLRAQALEPSVIRFFEWGDFEDLVRRNPEVGIRTIRLLCAWLGVAEDRLSDIVWKDVPTRLASLILKLSEHQGVVTHGGIRKLPIRYTHQQLGTMIGANREAVTKAFGRLRESGAVQVRERHIHVTDVDALERLAEAGR